MDNTRHCIAVLLSEVCEVYQTLLLKGIKKKAAEYGYNTAVFASFFARQFDSSLNEQGENNIFKLINYNAFDGFVVVPNAMSEALMKDLEVILKEIKKPVVYIDMESDIFYSVCADDYNSVKTIVNHLIKEHGFTRINCITGFPGFNISEARLRGYKDALTENNIELEEDRYTYGDFWKIEPVKFVEHIFSCGLELPQAIVCANDTMAIATCDALTERGLKVPDDIAVTGFDRIVDGRVFHPQISSAEPALENIGAKSVEVIIEALLGNNPEKIQLVEGNFFPTESCGCPFLIKEKENNDIDTLHKYVDLSQYFVNSLYMYENLQESENIDDLFLNLAKYRYMLDGLKEMNILICENWDVLNEQDLKDKTFISGYPKYVIKRFFAGKDCLTLDLEKIESEKMFPPLFDSSLPPDMYFFFPVNFQNVTFGYSVCTCDDETVTPNSIFRNWIKYLANALEHLRSKQHLEWALKRIERISEMDALTGVYNRLGYDNRVNKLFKKAMDENKQFLIIMGDLDCLKKINDNFGHAEGDNAIRIIAKAFQNSFTEDEVCARIGGDEFIMFGEGDFDNDKLNNYFVRIREYLQHYNQNSTKPYIIDVSLGLYCEKVSDKDILQDWIDKADENMYQNKKGKVKTYLKDEQQ